MKKNIFLPLDLQYFAEGDDAGQGTDDQQQQDNQDDNPFAQDKGTDQQNDDQQANDDPSKGGDDKNTKDQPSAEEQQQQAADAFAKEQGYESAEAMKEALGNYQAHLDSQKSEQEKQQEKLTNLEKDSQAKDEQLQNANAQISAMKQGVDGEYLNDVILLAKAKTSDDVTMDNAIEQVLERYPHFKGEQQQGQGPSFGQDNYQQQAGTSDDFLAGLKPIAGGKK